MNQINLSGTTLTFPVTVGEVAAPQAVCGKGNTHPRSAEYRRARKKQCPINSSILSITS
jgi:hypothetical protein